MKSGTSLFNRSFSANLLKRCWPLWAAYLCICLMSLPGRLYGSTPEMSAYSADPAYNHFEYLVISGGCDVVIISFVVAIIVAMAMFSFLYNSRTCDMIAALPLKRETVFFTAWATGLLPLITADIFTVFVTFLLYGKYLSVRVLFTWLGLTVMGNVAFYGFSVFCAMLTGSLFILPLVYVVLSFTVNVAEGAVLALLSSLVYGFAYGQQMLSFLSPVADLYENLQYTNLTQVTFHQNDVMMDGGQYHLQGLPTLIFTFAAGILFSFFALLLYRKRRMETAGDTVSIPILKPVFKYCMACGSALVLGCVISHEYLAEKLSGIPLAAGAFVFMAIGAGIGYFVAEMLIQKTMKVLPGSVKKAKGLLLVVALCAVFVFCCEADVFGYEQRVPDADEIESVHVTLNSDVTICEKENMAAAAALHKNIIDAKEINMAAAQKTVLGLTYELKNGRAIHRLYMLAADEEQLADERSNLREAYALVNTSEAVLSRLEHTQGGIEVTRKTVTSPQVQIGFTDDASGCYDFDVIRLTAAEFMELYTECIYPDAAEGLLGQMLLRDSAQQGFSVSIFAQLNDELQENGRVSGRYGYISLEVTREDCRTARWLQENTEIQAVIEKIRTEHK